MKILLLPILLQINLLWAAPKIDFNAPWELHSDRFDVTIYRLKGYQGEIVPIKGETVLPHNLTDVVAVLADTPRKHEWAANAYDIKIVKEFSPYHRLEYFRVKFPLWIWNRDFLVEEKIKIHEGGNKISIRVKSIPLSEVPEYPTEKLIRGAVFNTDILLERRGDKTFASIIAFTDPKGKIPKWAVNIFMEIYSRKLVRDLNRQIRKKLYSKDVLTTIDKYIDQYPTGITNAKF